jgi:hypothetical protein
MGNVSRTSATLYFSISRPLLILKKSLTDVLIGLSIGLAVFSVATLGKTATLGRDRIGFDTYEVPSGDLDGDDVRLLDHSSFQLNHSRSVMRALLDPPAAWLATSMSWVRQSQYSSA